MTDMVWKKSYFLKSNFAELLYSIQKSLSTYPRWWGGGQPTAKGHETPDTMVRML